MSKVDQGVTITDFNDVELIAVGLGIDTLDIYYQYDESVDRMIAAQRTPTDTIEQFAEFVVGVGWQESD